MNHSLVGERSKVEDLVKEVELATGEKEVAEMAEEREVAEVKIEVGSRREGGVAGEAEVVDGIEQRQDLFSSQE